MPKFLQESAGIGVAHIAQVKKYLLGSMTFRPQTQILRVKQSDGTHQLLQEPLIRRESGFVLWGTNGPQVLQVGLQRILAAHHVRNQDLIQIKKLGFIFSKIQTLQCGKLESRTTPTND